MSRHLRILTTTTTQPQPPPPSQVDPTTASNDFVVILAALLCALVCVLGLIAVARCTWIRRISGIIISGGTHHAPPVPGSGSANKGLKKKILKTLPKVTYSLATVSTECDYKVSDCCAICLTEFEDGDEIRVLPMCKHVFHVTCIDTWFGSHSSCPSCRQILTPAPRCRKCGELPLSPAEVAGDSFLP